MPGYSIVYNNSLNYIYFIMRFAFGCPKPTLVGEIAIPIRQEPQRSAASASGRCWSISSGQLRNGAPRKQDKLYNSLNEES